MPDTKTVRPYTIRRAGGDRQCWSVDSQVYLHGTTGRDLGQLVENLWLMARSAGDTISVTLIVDDEAEEAALAERRANELQRARDNVARLRTEIRSHQSTIARIETDIASEQETPAHA